jgi:hypothetical protein
VCLTVSTRTSTSGSITVSRTLRCALSFSLSLKTWGGFGECVATCIRHGQGTTPHRTTPHHTTPPPHHTWLVGGRMDWTPHSSSFLAVVVSTSRYTFAHSSFHVVCPPRAAPPPNAPPPPVALLPNAPPVGDRLPNTPPDLAPPPNAPPVPVAPLLFQAAPPPPVLLAPKGLAPAAGHGYR